MNCLLIKKQPLVR